MKVNRVIIEEYMKRGHPYIEIKYCFSEKITRQQKKKIKLLIDCFPQLKIKRYKYFITVTKQCSLSSEIYNDERATFRNQTNQEIEKILKSY